MSSVYVLDVQRFDKAYFGNVRYDRHVVYGGISPDGTRHVNLILDDEGKPVDLGTWMVAERTGLYEEISKAENRWNWHGDKGWMGRNVEVPGRVK